MMRRRDLLSTLGVSWFADQVLPDRGAIGGRVLGASHRVGHLLREPPALADGPAEHTDVVIVGSGASGLNAAWRLRDAGVSALVLELEPFVGGTSTFSDDGVVPHPFGAHYLPVPERGATSVARLLEALGVITGWDAAGRPVVLEEMLCHAPEERVHFRGKWHAGLVPADAADPAERAELARFVERRAEMQRWRGRDGRHAFAIPFEHSSRDPEIRALDGVSMATWLAANDFASPLVRWYAGYAALDDFGADLDDVSAWAVWHYFASRRLETEQLEGSRYLVWPEGNGWLVRHLVARVPGEIRTGALVTSVARDKTGVLVTYVDANRRTLHRVHAKAAVLAVPAFVARRVVNEPALVTRKSSPWLVCNLHVQRPEEPNRAWDSVLYESASLGYVDAGHQLGPADETVLTYFRAYGAADVAATRRALLARSWVDHASSALADLRLAHPDIIDQTQRIDAMVWGHAMPRPTVGFLQTSAALPLWLDERVAWGHVDQTGFALFEEASFRGVRAAEAVLDALGAARGESWL